MKKDNEKIKALKLKAKKYIVFRNREIQRKLDELRKKKTTTSTKDNMFTVYKDKNGRSRWVSLSSNAFRDKDQEIVSTKALKTTVKRADRTYTEAIKDGATADAANLKARGPLRWWHVPGLDLGICDFQMVHGRILLESGTFNNERIAQKMSKARNLNVSIGFRHPKSEPDKKGIFNTIVIFERSPTPKGRAANNFTSLHTKGAHMLTDEKTKALRLLLGDEADHILAAAKTTEKAAAAEVGDVYGESFKSDDAPTVAQLMELWNAYKEAAAEEAGDQLFDDIESFDDSEEDPADEAEQTAVKMDGMEELKARVDKMDKRIGSIMAMLGNRGEEEKKKEEAIATLEAELSALKGESPRAANGYRASMSAPTIKDDAPSGADWTAERQKAAQEMGPAGQLFEAAAGLTAGLFNK